MDQQPTDSKYKLWQGLSDKKLYTKSYEDFDKQFSTDKAIGGLYDALSTRKLYTKSKEDFSNQFFSTKDATVDKKSDVSQKPIKQEEPYNFEKSFLYNIGADEWVGSVGRVKATPMQLMEEEAKKPQKAEKVYKAPTGPIDIKTQEDLKKSEDAFEKFTEKRLKGKGVEFKKDDANYKKEKQLILNDIKNGDIFGFVNDNGDIDFARSAGYVKGTINSAINSFASEAKAVKVNTISDPRELADYANYHEQVDIEERAPEIAQIAGGVPKLIGTIALGTYAGGPTGGASLLAADAQWVGMSEKRLELYYKKRNELINKDVPKEQAEYEAAAQAMQDAPAAAIPSAITNYVMASMGGAGKSITPLSASRETFKKYALQPTKIAALGAAQPLVEYGIEREQGYDVKFQDAVNSMGKQATDFWLMDFGMNTLMHPGKFAKAVVSSAKEYLANVPKPIVESMASKYGTDGKTAISTLDTYNKAREKVAPYMPQDLVHHVAGLQEAIDKKTATIKGLESDGNIPKTIIDTEQQKLDELKKRQQGIINTGNPNEFEIDDKTGEPVIKEAAPAKTEVPKVELTDEQKQSNIDKATAEQRAEAINQTEKEYGSTTGKGVPTGEAAGVSGEVPPESAPKIESLKSATPEERTDFEQWKSRTYKSESDIDREYESSKLGEYGQSREEFLLGKYCK